MRTRILGRLTGATVVALCLSCCCLSAARAQDPTADRPPTPVGVGDPGRYPDPVEAADRARPVAPKGTAAVESPKAINYQGFVTDNLGAPLQGAHNFAVYLYDAAAAGAVRFGREDHLAVNVVNGHFHLAIGAGTLGAPNVPLRPDAFLLDLWLEVWVDGAPLPRQPLRAVPWAYGLIQGAIVEGDPSDWYALSVVHLGAGANDGGIYARGNKHGLYAEETGSGSDAIYSTSFVNANGYRSRSDSYVWVPALGFEPSNPTFGTVGAAGTARGAATLRAVAGTPTTTWFYLPMTLAGVLFGQNVTVEQVTIYYKTSNAANAFITETSLHKLTDADSEVSLFVDTTDRTSAVASLYSLTPAMYDVLDSVSGPLTLRLACYFVNTSDYVQVGMVRVRLGHTETP